MAQSLYKIAEQCQNILGKGTIQSLVASVVDAYAAQIKREWYENRADSVAEIDGVFLVPFKDLEPLLDLDTDMYYIVNPSSYLRLPQEGGINYVGFSLGQKKAFAKISAGGVTLWNGLKASVLGGAQTYYVEGPRTYFPKMTSVTAGKIMVRYVCALDNIDPETDLNIPPDVASAIIDMVVAKYSSKPPVVPENLN